MQGGLIGLSGLSSPDRQLLFLEYFTDKSFSLNILPGAERIIPPQTL